MKWIVRVWTWIGVLAAVAVVCLPAAAQQPAPAQGEAGYRKLAPGVMVTVDNARKLVESFSRHNVVELLTANPEFQWAQDVPFRHNVWALEFQFKPMRMMWVDIPQADGTMKKTLIWYMVYSVSNKVVREEELNLELDAGGNPIDKSPPPQTGWIEPFKAPDGTYKVKCTNKPVRFIPTFLLEGRESSKGEGAGFGAVYPDQVIPIAVDSIRSREDRKRPFYNTVEMCRMIAPGETLWGAATWIGATQQGEQGVDPRIDRFSVYVQGLTNAYKWKDDPALYAKVYNEWKNDPSKNENAIPLEHYRWIWHKILKINFWRPGDEFLQHEREIYYGIPANVADSPGKTRESDYGWVYLPSVRPIAAAGP